MEYKLYSEKELISFGNYLLSKERAKLVKNKVNKDKVSDSDLQNFDNQYGKEV